MTTTLDLTKPVQTRDGRPVRIYATDAGGKHPVHGAFLSEEGEWQSDTWTPEGKYLEPLSDHCLDLINIPPKPRVIRFVEDPEGRYYEACDGSGRMFLTVPLIGGPRYRREVEEV